MELPKQKLCRNCQKPIRKKIKNKKLIGISNFCSTYCWTQYSKYSPSSKLQIVQDLFEEGLINQKQIHNLLDVPSIKQTKQIINKVGQEIKKEKPDRDIEYREFVRTSPCCNCGDKNTVAHHSEIAGLGIKGSDFSCVALCPKCHRAEHDTGLAGIDWQKENIKILRAYIRYLKGKKWIVTK